MKTLPLNLSRTVPMNSDDLLQKVELHGANAVGKTEVDEDGSGTLTRLERNGNTIEFAFEFDQGGRARGQGQGVLTLTALGATSTRLDCKGTLDLEGAASKMPNFVLNKMINKEIDKLLTDLLAELNGPGNGLAA